MSNFVAFVWRPDDEWIGQLIITAQCDGFGGEGAAWFNREEIERFSRDVEVCPLPPGAPVTLEGGYENLPMIDLAISQHDGRGTILVSLALKDDNHLDLASRAQSVNLRLFTHYSSLASFASQVRQALNGGADKATLNCL